MPYLFPEWLLRAAVMAALRLWSLVSIRLNVAPTAEPQESATK